jgi:hypothetical protein
MDVVAYGTFLALDMERLHDGAGAVFKRFIQQVQLDVEGPQFQNVE